MRVQQKHTHYYAPGRIPRRKNLALKILPGIAFCLVFVEGFALAWANDLVSFGSDLASPTAVVSTPHNTQVVRSASDGGGKTGTSPGAATTGPTSSATPAIITDNWQYNRYVTQGAAMVDVFDSEGWLATLTTGARTVTLRGEVRQFAEPTTTAAVIRQNKWVRLLPSAFDGTVDTAWLTRAVADKSLDVLAIAMQYSDAAQVLTDSSGKMYASDADYGPLLSDGTRQEGSDYNDYLGISVTYNGITDEPEPDQLHSLDCSGFIRMIWGYRLGLPLEGGSAPAGSNGLPRRAVQMAVNSSARSASNLNDLQPGDLVFFDVSSDDGTAIDHVGMFMGVDLAGKHRFISSRKTANGPTMGDSGGKSILDGTGIYANAYRATRRL